MPICTQPVPGYGIQVRDSDIILKSVTISGNRIACLVKLALLSSRKQANINPITE